MNPAPGTAPSSDNGRWWLPTVLGAEVLLFLPGLLARGLIGPPAPKYNDGITLLYPWHLFWRDEVRAGRPPFWNPYAFGGTPLFAEPQAQTFYPAHLLSLVLPPEFAFTLSLLLHVMIGSALMYALVRQLGANRIGAAVSALVYGLHAQMIGFVYTGWIHQVAPMALAPGVIWGLVRALQDGRRWPGGAILLTATLLGIQIISGHPEWVRYTLFIATFVTLGGVAISTGLWRRLTILAAIVGLGAAIGGVQLLPTIQAAQHSARAHDALASATVRTGAGLPFISLPTILVPKLFGPWDAAISAGSLAHKLSGSLVSFTESIVYVGILPLALALIGWRASRQRRGGVWIVIAIAGLLFALNDWTHLQNMFDRVVRLDAAFRSPARFVFLTNFSLAVLAGLGLSQLAAVPSLARQIARAAILLGILLATVAGLVWFGRSAIVSAALTSGRLPLGITEHALIVGDGGRSLGLWAVDHAAASLLTSAVLTVLSAVVLIRALRRKRLANAFLIAVIVFDLGLYGWAFLTSVLSTDRAYAEDAALLRDLADSPKYRVAARGANAFTAGDNVTIVLRVRSLLGYDSFTLKEWDRLRNLLPRLGPQALAQINVTDLVERHGDAVVLAPLTGVPTHLSWTPYAVHVPDADAAAESLTTSVGHVVLEGSAEGHAQLPASPRQFVPASSIEYDVPGKIRGNFSTELPGWIVFSEVMYPGWVARVNGMRVPIERAFGIFQAIQLPAGQTATVEFEFQPAIVRWGAATSVCGLLAALTMWRVTRTRRSNRPAERVSGDAKFQV